MRWLLIAGLCVLVGCAAQKKAAPLSAEPRVFLLDGHYLASTRDKIRVGDKSFDKQLELIHRDGDDSMHLGPWAVVNKAITPPSGDKHDYASMAPYFWPNPKTATSLPYVRRDGQRNPEIYTIRNHIELNTLMGTVQKLALAYYFTGDEKYAQRATFLLRTWFLDPATRMNPNLNYAQFIRGINSGRGIGIIETAGLASLCDSMGLLGESKSWTAADQQGMEKWYAEYLNWLRSSAYGLDESAALNNHGTIYDVQVVTMALFLNDKSLARDVLERVGSKRIAVQIEPDGRQTLEVARTKAWGYSTGNLRGLMMLARLGDHVGVDLWNYKTPDGRCLQTAFDWMLPYGVGEKKWPYPQIVGYEKSNFYALIAQAAQRWPSDRYTELAAKFPTNEPTGRGLLVRPSTQEGDTAPSQD